MEIEWMFYHKRLYEDSQRFCLRNCTSRNKYGRRNTTSSEEIKMMTLPLNHDETKNVNMFLSDSE